MTGNQPTPEYRPEFTRLAYIVASRGHVEETLAQVLKVPVYTVYDWTERVPEFAAALERGYMEAVTNPPRRPSRYRYPAYTWALQFAARRKLPELAAALRAKMAEMKAIGPDAMAGFTDALWNDVKAIQPLRNIPQRVTMTGRPKVLTPEMMTEICDRIVDGETIRQIAQVEHMPAASTIYLELGRNPAFSEQYARAREAHLIRMEDELVEIADDASNDWMERRDKDTGEVVGWQLNGEHIQRSKVRIDTRKWLMSKRAPKRYGERVQQDIEMGQGGDAIPIVYVRSSSDGGQAK